MNYTKAQAFSTNLFPKFFIPEFIIKDLKCIQEHESLDSCSYQLFYDYYVENIAGVVCELDGTNSSGAFQIAGIPLVIDSQVRIH